MAQLPRRQLVRSNEDVQNYVKDATDFGIENAQSRARCVFNYDGREVVSRDYRAALEDLGRLSAPQDTPIYVTIPDNAETIHYSPVIPTSR